MRYPMVMIRRLLPVALALFCGCASAGMRTSGYYGETQTLASNDCQANDLGWWEGRLNRCSWYPFAKDSADD